jgi:hypothetical protein
LVEDEAEEVGEEEAEAEEEEAEEDAEEEEQEQEEEEKEPEPEPEPKPAPKPKPKPKAPSSKTKGKGASKKGAAKQAPSKANGKKPAPPKPKKKKQAAKSDDGVQRSFAVKSVNVFPAAALARLAWPSAERFLLTLSEQERTKTLRQALSFGCNELTIKALEAEQLVRNLQKMSEKLPGSKPPVIPRVFEVAFSKGGRTVTLYTLCKHWWLAVSFSLMRALCVVVQQHWKKANPDTPTTAAKLGEEWKHLQERADSDPRGEEAALLKKLQTKHELEKQKSSGFQPTQVIKDVGLLESGDPIHLLSPEEIQRGVDAAKKEYALHQQAASAAKPTKRKAPPKKGQAVRIKKPASKAKFKPKAASKTASKIKGSKAKGRVTFEDAAPVRDGKWEEVPERICCFCQLDAECELAPERDCCFCQADEEEEEEDEEEEQDSEEEEDEDAEEDADEEEEEEEEDEDEEEEEEKPKRKRLKAGSKGE